jgi:hypothetical protein
LDVPELVVMVTGVAVGGPVAEGTVTVHVDGAGQSVGATCPPKRATICPSELSRLVPDTTTDWPGTPVAGARDERTGAAAPGPIVDAVVVVGGVVVGVVVVGAGAGAADRPAVVADVWSAVRCDAAEPMRPAVTSTRATAAMPMEISHRRSLRRRSPGRDLGAAGRPGDVGARVTPVGASAPVVRLARRAASAMASRAPALSSFDGRFLPG